MEVDADVLLPPIQIACIDFEPYPIPWLDKNGSHNQAGPSLEPSHIFHFKGRIARCADFVGSGVDGSGERLAFGLPTTDNSFMDGECWTSQRQVREVRFAAGIHVAAPVSHRTARPTANTT